MKKARSSQDFISMSTCTELSWTQFLRFWKDHIDKRCKLWIKQYRESHPLEKKRCFNVWNDSFIVPIIWCVRTSQQCCRMHVQSEELRNFYPIDFSFFRKSVSSKSAEKLSSITISHYCNVKVVCEKVYCFANSLFKIRITSGQYNRITCNTLKSMLFWRSLTSQFKVKAVSQTLKKNVLHSA